MTDITNALMAKFQVHNINKLLVIQLNDCITLSDLISIVDYYCDNELVLVSNNTFDFIVSIKTINSKRDKLYMYYSCLSMSRLVDSKPIQLLDIIAKDESIKSNRSHNICVQDYKDARVSVTMTSLTKVIVDIHSGNRRDVKKILDNIQRSIHVYESKDNRLIMDTNELVVYLRASMRLMSKCHIPKEKECLLVTDDLYNSFISLVIDESHFLVTNNSDTPLMSLM